MYRVRRCIFAGAQCAHAAVGAVEYAPEEIMVRWKSQGQPKVCLQAQQDVILQLERQAKAKAMTCCLVRDAGRTQIAPGSKTVLAIGPDTIGNINELTGSLKLL
jgi:PTH2 family peptidyl-tRNA hydrolase